MSVFDKIGRLLTRTTTDSEFTTDGLPKTRVSDKPVQKVLEDIYTELRLHREFLGQRKQSVELVDNLGTSFGVERLGNVLKVFATNPGLEIARGKVPGVSFIHKFGRNPDVGTATDPEDIWDGGGIWVAPTTARIHQITSSNAEDGAGTQTGALTLEVLGLDPLLHLKQQELILNGQSNVATLSFAIIYRMKVLTAGSTGRNVGIITATADTDGTVTAQINATNNQTGMAIYQIPAGKTGYMTNFYGSLADSGGVGANVDLQLLVQSLGGVFQVKQFHGLVASGSAHFNHLFPILFPLEAKETIKMQAKTTSASNANVSAGFDIILIDE
ncbi:hypothetical protein LCGC14_2335400 [marine sediment metagenome]|uniref:Uncharacterized protein n=1 Tax=marine sediment metagenome TaxID=412755 RepID=A0A0F9F8M7_9ZZZZ